MKLMARRCLPTETLVGGTLLERNSRSHWKAGNILEINEEKEGKAREKSHQSRTWESLPEQRRHQCTPWWIREHPDAITACAMERKTREAGLGSAPLLGRPRALSQHSTPKAQDLTELCKPRVVAHTCNHSRQEAGSRKIFVSSRPSWDTYPDLS